MARSPHLLTLTHPYRELVPVDSGRDQIRQAAAVPGSALVWRVDVDTTRSAESLVESRPGGLALIAILPGQNIVHAQPDLMAAIQRCRPHGLLPTHERPVARELAHVLRRPPIDLPAEITDYLSWRGITVDRDTTHLLRRIVELSAELRSITALSRSLYLSRRALGRRLMTRGLPVPSHWLQLSRILRLTFRLQNSEESIFSIAYQAGYPDGFSVSNQMHRLIGYRPSQVREYLGWEWIFEAWLRSEADAGRLAPSDTTRILDGKQANPLKRPPPAKGKAKSLRRRQSVA